MLCLELVWDYGAKRLTTNEFGDMLNAPQSFEIGPRSWTRESGRFGPVAQWTEQRINGASVAGSIPARGAKFFGVECALFAF